MRAGLLCLLGWTAGAPGRDVPVYREYSQPIFFYDEQGDRAEFTPLAPDLSALRQVRDVQAQDAMLGREAVLDLTFGKGGSIFGLPAPLPGKLTPMGGSGEEARRGKNPAGQNWLAKSLSLPSLGQKTTNAAVSAMSAGARESNWGWLADEVATPAEGAESLQDKMRSEAGQDSVPSPETALREQNNPFESERSRAQAGSRQEKAGDGSAADDAISDRVAAQGQKPSDRATERSEASNRDLSGGDGLASPTMKTYREASAMAEMSQTRQLISDFSASARPDFASLRESLLSAPADSAGGTGPSPAAQTMTGITPRGGSSSAWGSWGGSSAIGSRQIGSESKGTASWRGSWSAQNAGGSAISRFETAPNPISQPVEPAQTREVPRTGPASGGYKPAWF